MKKTKKTALTAALAESIQQKLAIPPPPIEAGEELRPTLLTNAEKYGILNLDFWREQQDVVSRDVHVLQ